jgi:hypothetical protein
LGHEVQETLVIRREERVVLPQNLARGIAEQTTNLRTQSLATKVCARDACGHDPLRQRLEQPLEPTQVGTDPLAA